MWAMCRNSNRYNWSSQRGERMGAKAKSEKITSEIFLKKLEEDIKL